MVKILYVIEGVVLLFSLVFAGVLIDDWLFGDKRSKKRQEELFWQGLGKRCFPFIIWFALVGNVYAQPVEVRGNGASSDTKYKVNEKQDTVITHKYPDGTTVIEGSSKVIKDYKNDVSYVQPDGTKIGFCGENGERVTYDAYMARANSIGSSTQHQQDIVNVMGYAPQGSTYVPNEVGSQVVPVTFKHVKTFEVNYNEKVETPKQEVKQEESKFNVVAKVVEVEETKEPSISKSLVSYERGK